MAVLMVFLVAACSGEGEGSSSLPQPSPPSAQAEVLPESASQPEPVEASQPEPDSGMPLATEVNALSGLARSEGMLPGQRPVAVMVANEGRALPQRGLAAADVLVEMGIEAGNTRLMALYSDYRALPQVGPVRAVQDQFVQMALPLKAVCAHIDTTVYARNLFTVMGYQDLDGIYMGTISYWFDVARSNPKPGGKLHEYCWFTDAGLLMNGMTTLNMSTTDDAVPQMFLFSDKAPAQSDDAFLVDAVYSDTSFTTFTLNREIGQYNKTYFGELHADEDGAALLFNNVILLWCSVGTKQDGRHSEFDMSGGAGMYFNNGNAVPITWRKGEVDAPLRMFTAEGAELQVQPGKTYLGFVPAERPDALTWTPRSEVEWAADGAA